jgi:pimeloyl-ACP methyl ester carboxylesterase
MLCSLGYAVICPDYIGYGITADKIHPYLVMELTAMNVVDMYYAVKNYFEFVGLRPKHDDIYLMGYSQGGATTMAVEYMIEELYNPYGGESYYIPIRRVFAGGGPYDVKATYDRFVQTDHADYPVAVPLVLQGMIEGNGLDLEMSSIMQPWLCEKVDEWVNSKKFTTNQLNQLIGTKVTHEMLTETGMNVQSKEVSELYKAMVANSIVSYAWSPQAPVYILHSMDDETVTYLNATNAKQKWSESNIKYNFGHYGGHVKTCVRFLLTVRTLLLEDQKEEKADYLN